MSDKPQLPQYIIEHGNARLNYFKRRLNYFSDFALSTNQLESARAVIDKCFKILRRARQHNLNRNLPRHTKQLFRCLDQIDRHLSSLVFKAHDGISEKSETTFEMFIRLCRETLRSIRRHLQTSKLQEHCLRLQHLRDTKRRQRRSRSLNAQVGTGRYIRYQSAT